MTNHRFHHYVGLADGTITMEDVVWRSGICALAWLLALAISLPLDSPLAGWLHGVIPVAQWMGVFKVMKAPGHFLFTVTVATALLLWHPWRWRAGALLCVSGIMSGLLSALAKWGVGRIRPFKGVTPFSLSPFRNGIPGLFHAENLSFPSGHTCLAFATAACCTRLLPRRRWAFFGGACVVGTERILQSSHYLGDVVAAAGLGVFSAHLTWWLCRKLCPTLRSIERPASGRSAW